MCIIAAVATIPGREKMLARALESVVLNQSLPADVIFVSTVEKLVREIHVAGQAKKLPKLPNDPRVQFLNCTDEGPGTKLLCPLDALSAQMPRACGEASSTTLVLFDDDRIYQRDGLERVATCVTTPGVACSQYVNNLDSLDGSSKLVVGQAADMFGFRLLDVQPLSGSLRSWLTCVVAEQPLVRYHDDVYISAYLRFVAGVQVQQVPFSILGRRRPGHHPWYHPLRATGYARFVSLLGSKRAISRSSVTASAQYALGNGTFHACAAQAQAQVVRNAPTFSSRCSVSLSMQHSHRTDCVQTSHGDTGTFGCTGNSTTALVWVGRGCRGDFVCNGHPVRCDVAARDAAPEQWCNCVSASRRNAAQTTGEETEWTSVVREGCTATLDRLLRGGFAKRYINRFVRKASSNDLEPATAADLQSGRMQRVVVLSISLGRPWLANLTQSRLRAYCERHGYALRLASHSFDPSRHPSWSRIPFLLKVMAEEVARIDPTRAHCPTLTPDAVNSPPLTCTCGLTTISSSARRRERSPR